MAPAVCGRCPVFHVSNVKGIKVMKEGPRMSPEDLEFYRKMTGLRDSWNLYKCFGQ